MAFLCIDAGTTSIKAALVTDVGEFIDLSSKNINTSMPRIGVCEMDMNELWGALCEVLERLRVKNEPIWNEIAGIGVCAQGDGAWLLDEGLKPLRPAMLWNDTRQGTISAEELNSINKSCVEMNTTPLFSGAFPVLMKWLKENEPQNYSKTRWILHCKDWINYKLTGNISTDPTDASTAIFDIFEKRYRPELLEMMNIGEVKKWLPKVIGSSDIMGTVSREVSALTGIGVGTPVIAGSMDVLSVATGCDLTSPGQKGSIIGTTLGNFVVMDEESARKCKSDMGSVLCHTQSGLYIRQVSALSGASTLDWIQREIADGMGHEVLDEKLKDIPIGSNGVVFLPFLFGERAPFRLPNAHAAFLGLRVNHTKYHMVRAAFEGLAMVLYDCYQNLPDSTQGLMIAGGGARNEFLSQMICDVIGEPVVRINARELGILGVSKLLSDYLEINPAMKETGRTEIQPDESNHKSYMEIYDKYGKWLTTMKAFWT